MAGVSDNELSQSKALDQLARKHTGSDHLSRSRLLQISSIRRAENFFFTRDPMDRLVSAYRLPLKIRRKDSIIYFLRDKFECRQGKEFYYEVYTTLD